MNLAIVDPHGDPVQLPLELVRVEGEQGLPAYGEPQMFRILYEQGGTALRDVVIEPVGINSEKLQLAADDGGVRNVWAAPGEGVKILSGPEFSFDVAFWIRSVFSPEDNDAEYDFGLRVAALAIPSE